MQIVSVKLVSDTGEKRDVTVAVIGRTPAAKNLAVRRAVQIVSQNQDSAWQTFKARFLPNNTVCC